MWSKRQPSGTSRASDWNGPSEAKRRREGRQGVRMNERIADQLEAAKKDSILAVIALLTETAERLDPAVGALALGRVQGALAAPASDLLVVR